MRIALVLAGPYPDLRGSQVLLRHLAGGIRGRGHTVHLVTYGDVGPVPSGPWTGRILRDVALVVRLWATVRREAIDVIHAHNYEAAIAGLAVGRLTGRPVVYHGHTALADELSLYFGSVLARRAAARLGRLLDASVPRRADFCIAVSETLGDILRRRGVLEHGLACIPPVPPPGDTGRAPRRAASTGLVCYAGNLDGYQNLGFLLEAFARVRACVPGARLVIATHAAPDRALATPRDGVEIVRAVDYDQVRALLAAADVAVCPRVEGSGFPMKILNYMAAGKAIVASAGSAKGLRDGVTARVVPDGDADAFAAAVVDLLRDPGARARLGASARRAVEDPQAWEDILDRIEVIYALVLARQASPALLPRLSQSS